MKPQRLPSETCPHHSKVSKDGDNELGFLHAGQLLDRARNANLDGLDGIPGLTPSPGLRLAMASSGKDSQAGGIA